MITWKETRYLPCPLTPDELRARGALLADLITRQETQAVEHKVARDALKTEAELLAAQIHKTAGIVSSGEEERQMEIPDSIVENARRLKDMGATLTTP